jgi:hypothetical protein
VTWKCLGDRRCAGRPRTAYRFVEPYAADQENSKFSRLHAPATNSNQQLKKEKSLGDSSAGAPRADRSVNRETTLMLPIVNAHVGEVLRVIGFIVFIFGEATVILICTSLPV